MSWLAIVPIEPTAEMVEAGRWPAEDDGPVACWSAMLSNAPCPWQPIESAPDGPIWACDAAWRYEARVVRSGAEWECVNFDGTRMGVGFYPTHWMPLPPHPGA